MKIKQSETNLIIESIHLLFIPLFMCNHCQEKKSKESFYWDKIENKNNRFTKCKDCCNKIKYKQCLSCYDVLHKSKFKNDTDCIKCYNIMEKNGRM